MSFDTEFDAVIVGAGGCGLAAAIAIHDLNPHASIAVLDKADRACGNTVLSSGSIPAAGTRFQKEAGVHDTPQMFQEDLLTIAGEHEAMHLTRVLTETSASLVEWLVDHAHVRLTLVDSYKHIGHRVHRLHSPPSRRGADLVDDLLRECERRDIPVAWSNAVTGLASDAGRLQGVLCATPDGRVTRIGARHVILASNGYAANKSLLQRFVPEVAAAPYGGGTGSEGEAIVWGESLGAALANMKAYQGHASLADPHGSLVTWTVIEKGGIIVDRSGQRFGDESMGYSAFAALELQRGGPFWVIADTQVRDITAAGQEEYAELVAHGGVLAEALPQLCARTGIDAAGLEATLEAVRKHARGDSQDTFGRTHWGLGALGPQLTATRISPAIFHTQGGLCVDADGRVLTAQGTAIAGLWAGGGAACGISGNQGSLGYMSGNGLLSALGLGYRIGQAIAAELTEVES
ncbi:FAD-binding protein [Bordetella sp. BOR01]|uniref:FAD-dependent oxidoreductase n=1 Tax=Bordetella sp. BOR01 TaxID=2854779 RepID=UPI001C46BDE0|nr:FAD-binding protein [Bordetella sp. BOR01]MBV7484064.1 FAD-binding protein [Bordetella sp. BOR01]